MEGIEGIQDEDLNQGMFPMMQGMMMNLLSKGVLYPALDELRVKVNYVVYFNFCFWYLLLIVRE